MITLEAFPGAEALPPPDDALVAQDPLDHVGRDLVRVAHRGGGGRSCNGETHSIHANGDGG